MKLTSGAFEAIYQACDPVERRDFFTEVRVANPSGAVLIVEPPAPTLEVLMTGQKLARVKLMAIADGAWDVLPELNQPPQRIPGGGSVY